MSDPFAMLPTVFNIVMAVSAIGWLALIFFPRREWANLWVAGVAVPAVLGILYLCVMLVFWFQPPDAAPRDFLSLAGAQHLFQDPGMLVAAWTDIALLSIIVGAWMARKAMQVRMPYIYLLPSLLLTWTLPGVGFIFFCVVASFGGRWGYIELYEGLPPTESAPVAAVPFATP
ncbi:MAG TPA: abscisic acid-deficient protein Aba4 family protein [Thermoanaerobaculia bacterium]|jgi:hypothetical protein|nr:abscisic acid-deficient protein Aba4 family protein [Thermoanaerobaculia bacterium]